MKKHLKVILIILLILSIGGAIAWLFLSRTKYEPLPSTVSAFIESDDTKYLHSQLEISQQLYNEHYGTDYRLRKLKNILSKLDEFEQDLNTYLVTCDAKPKTTKDLTQSYKNLSSTRTKLLKECDAYIIRMEGNTSAEGQTIKALYNSLFDVVADYILQYSDCFRNTSNYIFSSVTNNSGIKAEIYSLYSYGVRQTLTNVVNSQFKDLTTIDYLNNTIKLDASNGNKHNIAIPTTLDGGEFNILALNFKKYYNNSNKNELMSNFNTYRLLDINPSTETSNEKLTIYYFKQMMEA